MTDNPYTSPKAKGRPLSGIGWKRVFLYALAAAAICFAVFAVLWSIHPSEVFDPEAPYGEFIAVLFRVRAAFGLGMWASLLTAIVGLIGWRLSGR
jgi:hypothetical protein